MKRLYNCEMISFYYLSFICRVLKYFYDIFYFIIFVCSAGNLRFIASFLLVNSDIRPTDIDLDLIGLISGCLSVLNQVKQ